MAAERQTWNVEEGDEYLPWGMGLALKKDSGSTEPEGGGIASDGPNKIEEISFFGISFVSPSVRRTLRVSPESDSVVPSIFSPLLS